RDLDVVPEHLVEADLERGDPGALALARLQPGDVRLAAVARVAQLVERAIVAGPDRVAVPELRRGAVDERAGQLLPQIGEQVEPGRRLEQHRALAPLEAVEGRVAVREALNRIAQGAELAGGGAPQGGAARQTLEVA